VFFLFFYLLPDCSWFHSRILLLLVSQFLIFFYFPNLFTTGPPFRFLLAFTLSLFLYIPLLLLSPFIYEGAARFPSLFLFPPLYSDLWKSLSCGALEGPHVNNIGLVPAFFSMKSLHYPHPPSCCAPLSSLKLCSPRCTFGGRNFFFHVFLSCPVPNFFTLFVSPLLPCYSSSSSSPWL